MSDPILDYWLEKNAAGFGDLLYRNIGKDLGWAAGRAMIPLKGLAKATSAAGVEAARRSAALTSLLSRRARHYASKIPKGRGGEGRFYKEVGHRYAPFVPAAAIGGAGYSVAESMQPQISWRDSPYMSHLFPRKRGYFRPEELNVFRRHGVEPK